jgi:curved DNA-binding protein CbpA
VKDYYRILGLTRSAKPEDVKAAYLRLAQKFHPDKNLDCAEWAADLFKEVQEAYEVLSDSTKRRVYDLRSRVQPIQPEQVAKDPFSVAIDMVARAASAYVPPDQMTELLKRMVQERGIPNKPVTLVDIAERCGLLKKKRGKRNA